MLTPYRQSPCRPFPYRDPLTPQPERAAKSFRGAAAPLAAAAFRLLASSCPLAVFEGSVTDIGDAARIAGYSPILAAADRGNPDRAIVTLRDAVSLSGGLGRGLPGCRSLGRSPTGRRIGGIGAPGIGRGIQYRRRAVPQGAVRGSYLTIARGRNLPLLDDHRLITAAFLFLPGKLKNAVDADAGDAGFPVGQVSLLGGDETAENAAFPGIDGIIPFVAVFAGRPSFRLAESVGLVDAAVEGLAPVFGQGFQDGGRAIRVGKGLPIGTVPRDGPGGLGRGCPPPPLRL